MAVYIKITATALIKVQDPYDEKTIEEAKKEVYLFSTHELCEEDYKFTIEDAD